MKHTVAATLFIFCLLTCLSKVARADVITSGQVVYNFSNNQFTLSGPGVLINGITRTLPGRRVFAVAFPGQSGSTGGRFDTSEPDLNLVGTYILGGVTYPLVFGQGNAQNSALSLLFDGAAFTAPQPFSAGFIVTTPFSLSGTAFPGNQLFSVPLEGSGTARLAFTLCQNNELFCLREVSYTFGQQTSGVTVTPTPEPATLLLLGSGFVGVAARLRNRRRAKARR